MRIEEAAKELGMSARHLRRWIKSGYIEATSRIMMQTIVRPYKVVDVDDRAIHFAKELLGYLDEHPERFGEWASTWMERLGIPAGKLAQMTKISKKNLSFLMQKGHYAPGESEGLSVGDSTVLIMGAIVREYIRQGYSEARPARREEL